MVDRDGLQFLLRASLSEVGRERRCSAAPLWVERTTAQAAELTDHRWSLYELLSFAVPPAPLKRRGRRPRWLSEAALMRLDHSSTVERGTTNGKQRPVALH